MHRNPSYSTNILQLVISSHEVSDAFMPSSNELNCNRLQYRPAMSILFFILVFWLPYPYMTLFLFYHILFYKRSSTENAGWDSLEIKLNSIIFSSHVEPWDRGTFEDAPNSCEEFPIVYSVLKSTTGQPYEINNRQIDDAWKSIKIVLFHSLLGRGSVWNGAKQVK